MTRLLTTTISYIIDKLAANSTTIVKFFSGILFTLALIFSLYFWLIFDPQTPGFQYIHEISLFVFNGNNIEFAIGIDGISLCFLLLTTFIMMLCFMSASNIKRNYKEFIFCLILIEIFLILSFIITDILFFYVFFESVLIPMFIMIGYWGTRSRKIKASYYFFLYTLFGSLFMLFGILYIYSLTGTTNLYALIHSQFSDQEQYNLWLFFFIPFAVKIPMYPFHLWLPEAHVEAPTIGSVILASLLLKLGGYGFIRFTIPLFPVATEFYRPIVYSLAVVSVVYASMVTIRQIDLKRIIAYSSIAHMNLIVLGLFSGTQEGIEGAIYLMVGHGIVSSALFFCVGILYDRYQSRLLLYYGGLARVMPVFSVYIFLFSLGNMGFPGTSNFIGELLILTGIFRSNSLIMIFAATGIVFSAIYSIWLFNRIVFGAVKTKYFTTPQKKIPEFYDADRIERNILFFLTILMFALGIHSGVVTDLTGTAVAHIIIITNL